MTIKDLPAPRVHLNGTGKEQLLEQLSDAIQAVHDAGRKLAAASPHPRDYYVQPPGTYSKAQFAHELRMRKLTEVADELQAIAEKVVDQ